MLPMGTLLSIREGKEMTGDGELRLNERELQEIGRLSLSTVFNIVDSEAVLFSYDDRSSGESPVGGDR